MISSWTRVSGCSVPGLGRRPGSVRSTRWDSSACRRSAAFSSARRSPRSVSISALARFASRPTSGRSATGIDERERRNWVRMPCRPRYFTRTCSRSALDFARAASPRAPFRISLARLSATLGLRGFGQLGERRRVLCRQLGQDLPVEVDARLLEPVAVREDARAEHRFLGRLEEAAPPPHVPLGLLEDLLAAVAGLGPALGSWHGVTPLCPLTLPLPLTFFLSPRGG